MHYRQSFYHRYFPRLMFLLHQVLAELAAEVGVGR
jgi:hypothetical protein